MKTRTPTKKLPLNDQEILLRKSSKVLVPKGRKTASLRDPRTLALQAEMMRLGFMMDEPLALAVSKLNDQQISDLYSGVVDVLRRMVGDDVQWEPFYPNFPQQVLEAPLIELFLNAICHYWSFGNWRPVYSKSLRLPALEVTKFKVLEQGDPQDVEVIFTRILGTNASVSEFDKSIVSHFLRTFSERELLEALPEQIPFKEQLCAFVSECLDAGLDVLGMNALKTATDILRVVTSMSGGDISLAENCKFKSLPRPLRHKLIVRLDEVINKDDIARHRNKWVRLAHSLHIGEYKKRAPKAFDLLSKARSGAYKFATFDSRVEVALKDRNIDDLLELLESRPGVFARRLDHAMRIFSKTQAKRVVDTFLKVAHQVDTRVLLQLYGHFKTRTKDVDRRLVFPKGKISKGVLLRDTLPAQGRVATRNLISGIARTLMDRFADNLPDMGAVYIDPTLKDCPVPLNLRSASDSLETVARGTKISLSDKKTLRMFIYWVGMDIDLSAAAFNEDFSHAWHISYTNLRETAIQSCHSGDIVRAPNGAAEFIDVDIESALNAGARYVVMNVFVFNGPTFAEHQKCYAGWMTRDYPNSNEVFDPKTVEQKIDLTAESRTAIPVIFDLKERKAIWLDMVTADRGLRGFNRVVNNVETNRAQLVDVVESVMSLDNKPTLYDLFTFHAQARGSIVKNTKNADIVIGWDGDIKPTDTNVILSEYL